MFSDTIIAHSSKNQGVIVGRALYACPCRRFRARMKCAPYGLQGDGAKSREGICPPGWGMFRNGVDILASARSIYFLAEIRYIALRFDMI